MDEKVVGEFVVKYLGDKEDVGGESGLEYDGYVWSVEEMDWVRVMYFMLVGRFDWDFDMEILEVDDEREDNDGSN